MNSARTKFKYLLAATFGLVIIGYGVYQMRNLISRPLIVVDSPLNGSSVGVPLITIRGQARRITKLFLNGEPLVPARAGWFESQLLLAEGYNIIRLNGEDRFGRQVKKKLELVLD